MAVGTFVDPELGHVKTMTGTGHVSKLDYEEGKRNAYVTITADGLKHPLGGFIDTHTAPLELLTVSRQAFAEGRRVRYRIDLHRKAELPLDDRKIEDLSTEEKVRTLMAIELLTGNGAVHNGASGATSPQGDAPPAGAPSGEPTPAGANAEPTPPDHDEIPPPSDDDGPGGAPPGQRRGPKLQEGKPWEADNSDGSPNLGSYEVVACVAMVEWAWELLVANWRDRLALGAAMTREGASVAVPSAPTIKQARALGTHLLFCADRVQAAIRPDGRVDRMASSHTRARGAVRSAVEVHAPPWGEVGEPVTAWRDAVTATATELLRAGIALLLEFEK